MSYTRRQFLESASAAGVIAPFSVSASHALPTGTERAGAEPRAHRIRSAGENLVARSLDLSRGDNVVIDDLHYETTYALYRGLAETRGVELRIVRSGDGVASVEEFAELVDDAHRLRHRRLRA